MTSQAEEKIARLAELQRASAEVHAARYVLVELVRKAHADGMSLREIAEAASMSHETVRRIARG